MGWVEMVWRWDGWWQQLKQRSWTTQMGEFRVAMMSTCCYPRAQWANISLQGLERRILTMGAVLGPSSDLELAIGTISPIMSLQGWQKALWKSRPVDISQWRQ